MADVKKFQVLDEFTMYEGEDWNAEGVNSSSNGYWVRAEDHEAAMQELRDEIARLKT